MNPRTAIMEALRTDSHVAPEIHNDFVDTQDNYHICTFYECRPLYPPGTLVRQSKEDLAPKILTIHRL